MTARAALLLCSILCSAATAQHGASPDGRDGVDPAGRPGALVIGGGGGLPDDVYERFVALAGGDEATVVIVPTASSRADTEDGRARALRRWREAHPEVSFTLLHTRDRAEADTAAFCAPLQRASGVWFGGGSQQRIADAFVGTRVEREVHALLARGGVVGGSSAGAAIQSRVMIARGKAPPQLTTGLDLLTNAIVDQHLLARERLPRLLQALETRPGRFGLGIDEGTAVVVRGRQLQVLGRSQALLVLAAGAGRAQRIQRLKAGDRADLVTWQRAARQRTAGPWPPAKLPAPVVAKGAVMLGGGGAMPRAVLERFVKLAGGAEAHIVVAPTASPRRPGAREDRMAALLRRMGVKDVYVLEPRHPSEVRAEHVAAIDRATGVWFGGGRQWRTVDAFEGTPVVAAFHRVLQRGGVVAGSSAGATIQGELLVRGNPLGNTDMWCEGYDRGFGFLPGCAVDQHFVARQRLQDLQALITALPQAIGIGVDEGTCALVTGPTLEVLGRSKVAILDGRGAAPGATPAQAWVAPGDRWDRDAGRRAER
ncbi:MAG: cyanophycinase [Planctomycetota bacterium]|nr:cyanophycinase [Planctomycetota bacterium]